MTRERERAAKIGAPAAQDRRPGQPLQMEAGWGGRKEREEREKG